MAASEEKRPRRFHTAKRASTGIAKKEDVWSGQVFVICFRMSSVTRLEETIAVDQQRYGKTVGITGDTVQLNWATSSARKARNDDFSVGFGSVR